MKALPLWTDRNQCDGICKNQCDGICKGGTIQNLYKRNIWREIQSYWYARRQKKVCEVPKNFPQLRRELIKVKHELYNMCNNLASLCKDNLIPSSYHNWLLYKLTPLHQKEGWYRRHHVIGYRRWQLLKCMKIILLCKSQAIITCHCSTKSL